uniref:Cadherin prodomain domain-containing protein n=1 Tax=Fundulus heteroclitus TaxID=8078 RepID=A0A3Q2QEH9_FUNHE
FAKMIVGCVLLACTLLVGASSTSCRPGFSQNFYTVIVPRDVLHGQSILKGKSAAAGYHLLTDGFAHLSKLHIYIITFRQKLFVSKCSF